MNEYASLETAMTVMLEDSLQEILYIEIAMLQ